MPGLRPIANAVMQGDYRDTVSHEKVSAMLRGNGLPRWSKLEPVVRVLAAWHTPQLDADDAVARLQQLWHAAHVGEPDVVAGPDGQPPAARETGLDARPMSPASDAGAEDLARVIGAELATQARAEREAEFERGYRDGVQFARELPSWSDLEELAGADFDVAAWIKPWRAAWGRIAARVDPYDAKVPEWAWKAARHLGALADPFGYDEFSFTPTDAYLTGFGAGLRAVWEAARIAAAGSDSPKLRTPAPPPITPATPRRYAVVITSVSPVYRLPDEGSEKLKFKYQGDVVELYMDQAPQPGWLAVRTPRDNPGYAWMHHQDLAERQ